MKREDAVKLAEQGLQELNEALREGHSDTLINYLDVMARFHHYSLNNTILIMLQNPEATHVAGFHSWKKLGRSVKKGEKGIGIFAPLVYRKKQDQLRGQGKDNSDDDSRGLHGFRVVHVFDLAQTEGDPIPEFAIVEGNPGPNLVRMESVIRESGIELVYEMLPPLVDGCSSGGKITIRPELPDAEKFAVAVHELAHERLHKDEDRNEFSKTVRETEAEATAFVVCRAFGLNSKTRSSDYIQLYQGKVETLAQSLDRIQKTSEWIITSIHDVQLPCDHTLHLRDDNGLASGSWLNRHGQSPTHFECRYCGKFYGYVGSKEAVR